MIALELILFFHFKVRVYEKRMKSRKNDQQQKKHHFKDHPKLNKDLINNEKSVRMTNNDEINSTIDVNIIDLSPASQNNLNSKNDDANLINYSDNGGGD